MRRALLLLALLAAFVLGAGRLSAAEVVLEIEVVDLQDQPVADASVALALMSPEELRAFGTKRSLPRLKTGSDGRVKVPVSRLPAGIVATKDDSIGVCSAPTPPPAGGFPLRIVLARGERRRIVWTRDDETPCRAEGLRLWARVPVFDADLYFDVPPDADGVQRAPPEVSIAQDLLLDGVVFADSERMMTGEHPYDLPAMGEKPGEVWLIVVQTRVVRGRVVTKERRPISGANVSGGHGLLETRTDSGGRFELRCQPRDLQIRAAGFSFETPDVPDGADPLDLGDIVLAPAQTPPAGSHPAAREILVTDRDGRLIDDGHLVLGRDRFPITPGGRVRLPAGVKTELSFPEVIARRAGDRALRRKGFWLDRVSPPLRLHNGAVFRFRDAAGRPTSVPRARIDFRDARKDASRAPSVWDVWAAPFREVGVELPLVISELLKPGRADVRVDVPGYRPFARKGLEIPPSEDLVVDVVLEPLREQK